MAQYNFSRWSIVYGGDSFKYNCFMCEFESSCLIYALGN